VPATPHEKLRQLSKDLEGVFLGQLFQAMRQTVPQGEDADPGRETFTAMLDDTLAREAAQGMRGGVSEALYRQLSRHLPPEPASGATGAGADATPQEGPNG
jgi:flagellar protein FlgJ